MDSEYLNITNDHQILEYIKMKWWMRKNESSVITLSFPMFYPIGVLQLLVMNHLSTQCYREVELSDIYYNPDEKLEERWPQSCFSGDYSEANAVKDVYADGSKPWQKFKSAKETKIKKFEGQIRSYDGSGYLFELPRNITVEELEILVNEIYLLKMISQENTSAVMIRGLFFDLNYKNFLSINQLWEFTNNMDIIKLSRFRIYTSKALLVTSEGVSSLLDMICIAASSIIVVISFLAAYSKVNHLHQNKRFFLLFWNLGLWIDVLILSLITSAFLIIRSSPKIDLNEIIGQSEYKDFTEFSDLTESSFRIRGILIFFISIRLIMLFDLNKNIYLVFLLVRRMGYSSLLSFSLLMAVFAGMALYFFFSLGFYFEDFNSILKTMTTTLSIYFFMDDFFFKFLNHEGSFTILSICFLVVSGYILQSIFICIIFENYRYLETKTNLFEELETSRSKLLHFLKRTAMCFKLSKKR